VVKDCILRSKKEHYITIIAILNNCKLINVFIKLPLQITYQFYVFIKFSVYVYLSSFVRGTRLSTYYITYAMNIM